MPLLENELPDVSPKSMSRRAARSSVVFSLCRAKFFGRVLPKIDRAIGALSDSLTELGRPVDVIVGKGESATIVKVKDYAQQARTAASLASLVEQQRSLLGFPSPGRRKDEDGLNAHVKRMPSVIDVSASPSAANEELLALRARIAELEAEKASAVLDEVEHNATQDAMPASA